MVRRLNKFYLNCISIIFTIKIKNNKNCYRNNINFTGSHNKIYFFIYAVLSSYTPPQRRGLANRPPRLGTGSVVQISQAVALVSYTFFFFLRGCLSVGVEWRSAMVDSAGSGSKEKMLLKRNCATPDKHRERKDAGRCGDCGHV